MTTTPPTIYKDLSDVLENGDEESARTFLLEHFSEFPQDMQDRITLAFFSEAVSQDVSVTAAQKYGLEAVENAEEVKRALDSGDK